LLDYQSSISYYYQLHPRSATIVLNGIIISYNWVAGLPFTASLDHSQRFSFSTCCKHPHTPAGVPQEWKSDLLCKIPTVVPQPPIEVAGVVISIFTRVIFAGATV
jgi:hypothetical protein